jgi:hypothetical protein
MTKRTSATWWARIYLSGPIGVIEQTCRKECSETGFCVTVTPTKFIYKGGEESGAEVGLVNYPKYPQPNDDVTARARGLAERLVEATCQDSYLLMTPESTEWVTKRMSDPKDSERLDWLSTAGEVSIDLIQDAPNDGDFLVRTDMVEAYGKTVREAIDNAAKHDKT